MKFDEIYKRVFLTEADEDNFDPEEVPTPDMFDDVEPLPEPGQSEDSALPSDDVEPDSGEGASMNLRDFMDELETFSDKLNGVDGGSLQQLAKTLDRPGTPFEGISDKISGDITRASEVLLSVAEKLKSYIISSAKG